MSDDVELFGEPTDEPIVVVGPDPSWPSQYEGFRSRLAAALGPAARIEHVGSTAVAGLDAKPVIDVQISVPDLADEDAYRPAIESLGLIFRAREPGHRYFRPPAGEPRTVHVHVCQAGSRWERDHLLLRDYLRAHPDRAAAYARMKRELAARYRDDRIAYTDAKDDFIADTLRAAEAWAEKRGWGV